jgi:predicted signal transduction protein with EAL and GGDEF domain
MKNNIEQFKEIAESLCQLYEMKDKCYGGSFSTTYKKLGIISAVTRISDKYNRLCNLATNPDIDNLGESIEDTLRDMASYCIITLIEMKNERDNQQTI